MGMNLVQVENITRYYGDTCAVNNVSFDIQRGEVLGFLGPNGAGKSTTMQIISGNLAQTRGEVKINGYDILDNPKQAKAEIGYLPEYPPLYRELTVDEYLYYCARLNRIRKDYQKKAVEKAKERTGLVSVGARLIAHLSKGFQQRVGIAQAIIHSPAVVILDEPTVGLDPIQIREIRELIRELGGEHSVILSTHILPEVQVVCDRVLIINKGEIILNDSIAGMQKKMQTLSLTAAFHVSPSVELIAEIDGVISVEQIDEGRIQLKYNQDMDPAEELVARSVENGWRLYDLVHGHKSLEQIFLDITEQSEHISGQEIMPQ